HAEGADEQSTPRAATEHTSHTDCVAADSSLSAGTAYGRHLPPRAARLADSPPRPLLCVLCFSAISASDRLRVLCSLRASYASAAPMAFTTCSCCGSVSSA